MKKGIIFFQSFLIAFTSGCSGVNFLSEAELSSLNDPSQKGHELSPLRIPIPSDSPLSTQEIKKLERELPNGMVYNLDLNVLLWIPKKGQSGLFPLPEEFNFMNPNKIARERNLPFKVFIETTKKNLSLGPPEKYHDSDVGYIFIHGRSEDDKCLDGSSLALTWGESIEVIAPNPNSRLVACYDGRLSVTEIIPGLVSQISDHISQNRCGLYKKCVFVTHSLGGLLLEHILIAARYSDSPENLPVDFPIYPKEILDPIKNIEKHTLLSINFASAAGGSKVSNMLEDPSENGFGQSFAASVANSFGAYNASARDLTTQRAAEVFAPVNLDVGIPFFMIGGFSNEIVTSANDITSLLLGINLGESFFNSSNDFSLLDGIVNFASRSDGVVSFRSSCGVLSTDENDGPGHTADIDEQFTYCFRSEKKANHYPWFVSNLNHTEIKLKSIFCDSIDYFCENRFFSEEVSEGIERGEFVDLSPVEIVRQSLAVTP